MAITRRDVLGWLALAALLAALAILFTLGQELRTGTYKLAGAKGGTELSFIWLRAAVAIDTELATKVGFTMFASAVTIGIGILSHSYRQGWQVLVITILCVAGAFLSFELVVQTRPGLEDRLNDIRYYGGMQDTNAEIRQQITAMGFALLTWFASFASATLGVSAAVPEGALNKLFRQPHTS
ncbi:hypothetical protein [Sphingopyxis fribergensis]